MSINITEVLFVAAMMGVGALLAILPSFLGSNEGTTEALDSPPSFWALWKMKIKAMWQIAISKQHVFVTEKSTGAGASVHFFNYAIDTLTELREDIMPDWEDHVDEGGHGPRRSNNLKTKTRWKSVK